MEVVVAFGEGVVRGCDDWFEEVGGLEGQGLQVEVPDEVFEHAELWQSARSVTRLGLLGETRKGRDIHATQKVNS